MANGYSLPATSVSLITAHGQKRPFPNHNRTPHKAVLLLNPFLLLLADLGERNDRNGGGTVIKLKTHNGDIQNSKSSQ